MSELVALSVTRPWSEFILRHGKTVENRTWWTTHRGPLLIHAAKSWQGAAVDFAERLGVSGLSWEAGDYPMGIVGLVDLVDICTAGMKNSRCDCGPWAAHGQMHWRLANPRPLREPVACGGALKLWTPPEDVLAAVLGSLALSCEVCHEELDFDALVSGNALCADCRQHAEDWDGMTDEERAAELASIDRHVAETEALYG